MKAYWVLLASVYSAFATFIIVHGQFNTTWGGARFGGIVLLSACVVCFFAAMAQTEKSVCPYCDSKTNEIQRLVKAIRDQADAHAEEARKLRELIQALRLANDGYRGVLQGYLTRPTHYTQAVDAGIVRKVHNE